MQGADMEGFTLDGAGGYSKCGPCTCTRKCRYVPAGELEEACYAAAAHNNNVQHGVHANGLMYCTVHYFFHLAPRKGRARCNRRGQSQRMSPAARRASPSL